MNSLKEYIIPFSGLKEGKHDYSFRLNKAFFEAFEYGLIEDGNVNVSLELEITSTMLVFNFELTGDIYTECDKCLGDLSVPINSNNRLIVKFGNDNYEHSEEVVVIPHGDHEFDTSKYIYEFVTLALPKRLIHEEGDCDPEMIKKLDDMDATNRSSDDIDPRWEALKGLNN